MDKYINRDDLLKAAWDKPTLSLSVYDIGNIKPVDVAPVRHGRWLNIEEYTVLSYNTYFPMTTTSETCSECNVRSGFLGRKGYVKDNSCPNCGAKMDLKGEDHED